MSEPLPAELPAAFRLSGMVTDLWIPQAIYVAAKLGVADVLAGGPRSSQAVAEAVDAEPRALHRLLRALAFLGVCELDAGGAFELTELGSSLRSDARDSVRPWVLLMGGARSWQAWSQLLDCIRTGKSVPSLASAEPFDLMETDPAAAEVFDASMMQMTKNLAGAIPLAYDFAGVTRLIDIGGGYGAVLPPILRAHPTVRGAVFDLPRCREGAQRLFEKTRLADRCEFIEGSFFDAIPEGWDAYLLKSVIHDWDDAKSVEILRNCRKALAKDNRLLLVEIVVPDRPGTSRFDGMIASTDLNMLVNTGGCERTETEYRALLEAAGLRIERVVPTIAALSVIEAWPA